MCQISSISARDGVFIGEQFIEFWEKYFILRPLQECALFMPGKVADRPTDAIHGSEVPRPLFLGNAL